MKKLLIAGAMMAAVAATPAKANPVLVTVPAWVIVATTAVIVTGMVVSVAVAKQHGCHSALVNGQPVWVCPH